MSTLQPGTRLGSYEILALLGVGGMGEVYRARDANLGREVALKVLPEAFSSDADRLARFHREARSLAALNHPGIAAIHGLETVESKPFLVLELVEGEELRDRLMRGAVPVEEALGIALQIAEALAEAHEKGLVHRDLKPANLKLTPERRVKLLDFGLAKALADDDVFGAEPSQSPTTAPTATQPGTILGTATYMSPEQAKGESVDHRSDLFSFGLVLFEMLTGRPAFARASLAETLSAILTESLPTLGLDPEPPEELQRILRKTLAKPVRDRYQSTADLAVDLRALRESLAAGQQASVSGSPAAAVAAAPASAPGDPDTTTGSTQRRRLGAAGWTVLALVVLAAVAASLKLTLLREDAPASGKTEAPRSVSVRQLTTASGREIHPAYSPDGSLLAYSGDVDSDFEIFVRSLTFGGREIQLTSDGQDNFQPAWSPDGQLLAYATVGRGGIWVVPALGGAARQITDFGASPAWSPDASSIVFQSTFGGVRAPSQTAPPPSQLWRVSTSGGTAEPLTELGVPPGPHGSPSFSPSGKLVAFQADRATPGRDTSALWLLALEDRALTRLETPCSPLDPVFSREASAVYFVCPGPSWAIWKVALTTEGEAVGPAQMVERLTAAARHVDVASGGKLLAFTHYALSSNIWSLPLSKESLRPAGPPISLTRDTNLRNYPQAFSPDGTRIAYAVTRTGSAMELWMKDATAGDQWPLARSESLGQGRLTWLAGGREVAFSSDGAWVRLDVETQRQRVVVDLDERWNEPQLSPDGERLAYSMPAAGVENVWVLDVETGRSRQVTFDAEFAGWPLWSPDGRKLAVEIQREGTRITHVAVVPAAGGDLVQLTFRPTRDYVWDWSPDGDKLLFARSDRDIWWVSVSDGSEQQLTSYEDGEFSFVRYPVWSPRGDQILYEVAHSTSDIWLLELE